MENGVGMKMGWGMEIKKWKWNFPKQTNLKNQQVYYIIKLRLLTAKILISIT